MHIENDNLNKNFNIQYLIPIPFNSPVGSDFRFPTLEQFIIFFYMWSIICLFQEIRQAWPICTKTTVTSVFKDAVNKLYVSCYSRCLLINTLKVFNMTMLHVPFANDKDHIENLKTRVPRMTSIKDQIKTMTKVPLVVRGLSLLSGNM